MRDERVNMPKFEITLGARSVDHRVVVDGKDITDSVRGVEIVAYGGLAPEVKLILVNQGVVKGDPEKLVFSNG
jgi:hypothetical protein